MQKNPDVIHFSRRFNIELILYPKESFFNHNFQLKLNDFFQSTPERKLLLLGRYCIYCILCCVFLSLGPKSMCSFTHWEFKAGWEHTQKVHSKPFILSFAIPTSLSAVSAVNTNVQGDVQSVLKENMFSQSLHIKEVKITEYKAEKKSLNLFFF